MDGKKMGDNERSRREYPSKMQMEKDQNVVTGHTCSNYRLSRERLFSDFV
jgi:hypothetical protein